MRARKWITVVLIAATAGLVLAGCGGGGSKKTEGNGASSTGGGGATISLAAKDFMFDPTTITATAGKAVTVTIKNEGQAEHNFSIESLKVNQDIEKGDSKTVTFTPTQSGSIQFFCEYHHITKGMVGTLTVT